MEINNFQVVEIFGSIDGEGKRTGELTTFIRFAGCNLNCVYCDTNYAKSYDLGTKMTLEEIVDEVNMIGYKNITITGGEPLARLWVFSLIGKLASLGYNVNIETNGSIPLYTLSRLKNVFYTMDYKSPSSGMEGSICLDNLYWLDEDDVLKFVVGNREDLDKAKYILDHYPIRAQVYLSPIFNDIQPVDIVDYMKENKETFKNSKVQVQLHKIIWDPNQKGV